MGRKSKYIMHSFESHSEIKRRKKWVRQRKQKQLTMLTCERDESI